MQGALPSVDSYLARLPLGVDSHPECQVKASLVHNAMGSLRIGPEFKLPQAVRKLLDTPPPVSVWVPEVHFNIAMLAILDAHFGPRNLSGYQEWIYEQNRKLFRTPLYRAVFLVMSPERLLHGLEKRWESFRRGSMLRQVRLAEREVELRLTSPEHLYVPLLVQGMREAVRAGIDSAGALRSQVTGEIVSPTEIVYRLTWE